MDVVTMYPIVVCLVSVALNLWVFGVPAMVVALPSTECMQALAIAAVLLTFNHTWLMTATELTRVRFRLFATPEEWAANGTSADDASPDGVRELQRRHSAHRNATENTAAVVLLVVVFAFTSPSAIAAYTWILGFAAARIGHAYGYLRRSDGIRGTFMTLGLLAMYGLASHLVLSLL
jgi:uncharacterized membrane protein YecN with MAPEG domain